MCIRDSFGVSKRSAEAREAGGVLLKGQGLVDAKSYYQMTDVYKRQPYGTAYGRDENGMFQEESLESLEE